MDIAAELLEIVDNLYYYTDDLVDWDQTFINELVKSKIFEGFDIDYKAIAYESASCELDEFKINEEVICVSNYITKDIKLSEFLYKHYKDKFDFDELSKFLLEYI